MKLAAIALSILSAALASAQSNPVNVGALNIPRINNNFYVNREAGWYNSIQAAVTQCAVQALGGRVFIVAGVTPTDTISAVTGGRTGTCAVYDENVTPTNVYTWNSGTGHFVLLSSGSTTFISALTGDGTATAPAGGGSAALTLASVVTASSGIGDASHSLTLVYDAKGRITGATSVQIEPYGTQTAAKFLASPTGASGTMTPRAIVAGDLPNPLAVNISGTAQALSVASTLPSGTLAVTQTALDASTKVATTAYADAAIVALRAASNTFSGPNIFSYSSIASTPAIKVTGTPFAGTGSTSYPLVYIDTAGGTEPTTFSTAGTMFAVNSVTGGAGNHIVGYFNGVEKWKITSQGTLTLAGNASAVGYTGATVAVTGAISGASVAATGAVTGATVTASGAVSGATYATATQCVSSASPAACGSAASGFITLPASASLITVNDTAVTANSVIIPAFNTTQGTNLGVTCNTSSNTIFLVAQTAGTSFQFKGASAPSTNPDCIGFLIIG